MLYPPLCNDELAESGLISIFRNFFIYWFFYKTFMKVIQHDQHFHPHTKETEVAASMENQLLFERDMYPYPKLPC